MEPPNAVDHFPKVYCKPGSVILLPISESKLLGALYVFKLFEIPSISFWFSTDQRFSAFRNSWKNKNSEMVRKHLGIFQSNTQDVSLKSCYVNSICLPCFRIQQETNNVLIPIKFVFRPRPAFQSVLIEYTITIQISSFLNAVKLHMFLISLDPLIF